MATTSVAKYNGGKEKNPSSEAEVAIFFDNTDKEFPTDDTVVKVSRIVSKTGQSKYKINDKMKTTKLKNFEHSSALKNRK